jgi:hypothetical protein
MPSTHIFGNNANCSNRLGAVIRGECDEDLNLTPEMRNMYKRSAKQYPYRSHLQWIRAVYALVGCVLMATFQGWRTFLSPMSGKDFVASYIAVSFSLFDLRLRVVDFHLRRFLFFSSYQPPTFSRPAGSRPNIGKHAYLISTALSLSVQL